jgi:hypothetical protein
MVLFTTPIEGNISPKYFKVFPDGVTYVKYKGDIFGYTSSAIDIIYNGTTYDCQPIGYHENQYLNPVCVEIILRSIP